MSALPDAGVIQNITIELDVRPFLIGKNWQVVQAFSENALSHRSRWIYSKDILESA